MIFISFFGEIFERSQSLLAGLNFIENDKRFMRENRLLCICGDFFNNPLGVEIGGKNFI